MIHKSEATVPFMRWDDFCSLHGQAHLFEAIVAEPGESDSDAAAVLRQIVARLRLHGDYAIDVQGSVRLVIETDYDRDHLRSTLAAQTVPAAEGWASRTTFKIELLSNSNPHPSQASSISLV